MKRTDKFGNKIYEKVWQKMIKNGLILKEQGFIESIKKPNLFYKKIDEGCLFADMRGTDIVPIWEDDSPLIYYKFNIDVPLWKKRRILKNEVKKCNGRFSFYEDNEPDGFMFNEEEDGYCKNCGKDFQNNGLFCCKECEEIYEKKILAKIINNAEICEICGKKIPEFWLEGREKAEKMLNIKLPKGKIDHHITYEEDETMVVCPSCHAKIHHSKDPKYDKYRPKDKRPKRKSQYKLVPCGLCKGKTRVPYDADKDKKYLCYRCKKKYRDYYRNWRKDSLSNPNEKHTKEYWEFTRKGS